MEILIDSCNGIYVPQSFIRNYDRMAWNVKDEDFVILEEGPDHPMYWEAWDDVMRYAHCDVDGITYFLHQDDDLFAVTKDDLEQMCNEMGS